MSDRVQALRQKISDVMLLAMSQQLAWCIDRIANETAPKIGRKDADELADQVLSFLASQEVYLKEGDKFVPLEIGDE